jgi:phage gpG-like protein
MLDFEKFFKAVLKDVKTDISDEFDRNFERKAFFDQKWPGAKYPTSRGSLMMRTGALRRGNQSRVQGNTIVFTNSQPASEIHNEGGSITVTAAMKKAFWAMYYKASGKVKSKKNGTATRATQRFIADAAFWKNMALMKVGSKINMPKRQFIGSHPQVDISVKRVVDSHIHIIEDQIENALKNKP